MTSHANRGMGFEAEIMASCDLLVGGGVGMIQKVPTPMRQSRGPSDKAKFWREKSTVDFIGVYKGKAVAFDAKETKNKSLSLSSIREHQREFLYDFEKAGGVAFIIVRFVKEGTVYAVNVRWLFAIAKSMGRKSVPEKTFRSRFSCETADITPKNNELISVAKAIEGMAGQ